MRGRNDAPHRQGQRGRDISLLHLLDHGAAGKGRLHGRYDLDGQARPSLRHQRLETILASVIDRREDAPSATLPNSTGESPRRTNGLAVYWMP